jgi:hypothetical protein
MPVDYQVQELRFGHIREIDGHSVTILAEKLECTTNGTEYAVELGSFINLAAPKSDLVAVVSGIRVIETPGADDSGKPFEDRKLVIATLVGFLT